MKNGRVWIRRITRSWVWIASVLFGVYVLMDEPNPAARRLLQFVAMAEILALALDSLCRRFDEADAKLLRRQLDIAAEEIDLVKDRHETDKIKYDEKIRILNELQHGRDPYNAPD